MTETAAQTTPAEGTECGSGGGQSAELLQSRDDTVLESTLPTGGAGESPRKGDDSTRRISSLEEENAALRAERDAVALERDNLQDLLTNHPPSLWVKRELAYRTAQANFDERLAKMTAERERLLTELSEFRTGTRWERLDEELQVAQAAAVKMRAEKSDLERQLGDLQLRHWELRAAYGVQQTPLREGAPRASARSPLPCSTSSPPHNPEAFNEAFLRWQSAGNAQVAESSPTQPPRTPPRPSTDHCQHENGAGNGAARSNEAAVPFDHSDASFYEDRRKGFIQPATQLSNMSVTSAREAENPAYSSKNHTPELRPMHEDGNDGTREAALKADELGMMDNNPAFSPSPEVCAKECAHPADVDLAAVLPSPSRADDANTPSFGGGGQTAGRKAGSPRKSRLSPTEQAQRMFLLSEGASLGDLGSASPSPQPEEASVGVASSPSHASSSRLEGQQACADQLEAHDDGIVPHAVASHAVRCNAASHAAGNDLADEKAPHAAARDPPHVASDRGAAGAAARGTSHAAADRKPGDSLLGVYFAEATDVAPAARGIGPTETRGVPRALGVHVLEPTTVAPEPERASGAHVAEPTTAAPDRERAIGAHVAEAATAVEPEGGAATNDAAADEEDGAPELPPAGQASRPNHGTKARLEAAGRRLARAEDRARALFAKEDVLVAVARQEDAADLAAEMAHLRTCNAELEVRVSLADMRLDVARSGLEGLETQATATETALRTAISRLQPADRASLALPARLKRLVDAKGWGELVDPTPEECRSALLPLAASFLKLKDQLDALAAGGGCFDIDHESLQQQITKLVSDLVDCKVAQAECWEDHERMQRTLIDALTAKEAVERRCEMLHALTHTHPHKRASHEEQR